MWLPSGLAFFGVHPELVGVGIAWLVELWARASEELSWRARQPAKIVCAQFQFNCMQI